MPSFELVRRILKRDLGQFAKQSLSIEAKKSWKESVHEKEVSAESLFTNMLLVASAVQQVVRSLRQSGRAVPVTW